MGRKREYIEKKIRPIFDQFSYADNAIKKIEIKSFQLLII